MQLLLETSGVVLRAERYGCGPEVILLHAGGERRQVWRPISRRLAAGGFASIALDQRGHGQSEGSRGDSIDAFAADLQALLSDRGGCPVVVGASLGGFAAMLALGAAARASPSAGLVLVDVVPDPDPERVRAYLAAPPRTLASSPLVTEILGRRADFRAAVARLSAPLMLIRGGRSIVTDGEVENLQRLAPQVLVRSIPEAGHLVAREAPHRLADLLLSFLAQREVRQRHRTAARPTAQPHSR